MARGKLRIYLGAAPGVGKTFAMLNEGWRARERGRDVVVAFVETHGRQHTAEQVRELEIVPRARLQHRGQPFEEMDVDAVLTRHPDTALVDELAHTNVPGSRNEKRWQDVEELLAAGINVISTVNIQHLESLNDVVEGITGIRQRETVPDAVVRGAEQIELVDMSPEALRRRMAHGNVYDAAKIDAALGNYFRPGNLAALRELALLWVADRVEESIQDYRDRHGIATPWETRERVVVALTGAPGGDNLVRRAARIASRTKSDLVGIHVRGDDGLTGSHDGALSAHRRLLEELGGAYREVVGGDVAATLVQAARAEHATQLVIGASHRSRWVELTRGSIVASVVRQSGHALDVHVISSNTHDRSGPSLPRVRRRLSPLTRRRRIAAFVVGLVGLPLLTLALEALRDDLGLTSTSLCYLLVVVVVATIGGAWPASAAVLAAFALLNWFFTPPFHTFTIARSRDVVALAVFVIVAGVVSFLVGVAARRSAEAHRARSEAQALAAMAGSLLREGDPLPMLLKHIVRLFDLEGAAVIHPSDGGMVAVAGPRPPAHNQAAFVVPLGPDVQLLVGGGTLGGSDREVLTTFADQLALALEGRRLQTEAAQANALAQANELRSALLAAVSHDLRTPLSSIKASSSSLLARDVTFDAEAQRSLLETIDVEADRLNDLVGNLLDMSRIQAGALVVKPQPMSLDEVVGGALGGLETSDLPVQIEIADTLPRILADP
ncbi:MAG: two-component system, OmpR family, sensor histidine kinase KdpD, partial [Acidimicrobiaceae bacterium]|nr:two-component system, OmpR family, sensor histidine kinase KdpD [Acidimicrobiaceae bacterium]